MPKVEKKFEKIINQVPEDEIVILYNKTNITASIENV